MSSTKKSFMYPDIWDSAYLGHVLWCPWMYKDIFLSAFSLEMNHHFWQLFSCLRLRQWPVTYLITLSDWIMSCQPGRHAVVTVCEPDWKHKWAAYKSFDETSSFNNL